MREILFRGKHYKTGKWLYGSLLQPINTKSTRINGTNHYCEVDPETVGQYTGLTDKNGVKIFEGDIVKHYQYRGIRKVNTICYVKWRDEEAKWSLYCCRDGSYFGSLRKGDFEFWNEVIGNIYDNPELLEAQK